MAKQARKSCPQCQRLQQRVAALEMEIQSLRVELRRLHEQLAAAQKDSSTSSKPPSSDIVKPQPPPPSDATPRSIGGQAGHAKHDRPPFPPGQVTHFEDHTLSACPGCGGPLRRNAHFAKVVPQVDIATPPLAIAQHTSPEYWCERCA